MTTKKFILSSAGLQSIILATSNYFNASEEFCFNFGDEELKTNYLYAEFISPKVSKIHQIDPTINYLNAPKNSLNFRNINKSLIDKVDELSRGKSIEVTKEMVSGLQQISIILGNSELFTKISELFEGQNEEEEIERCLLSLQLIENEMNFPNFQTNNQRETIIDFIASHFYLIEETKLLKISKNLLYSILRNKNLQLKTEDSLLDFINKLFEQSQDNEEPHKIEFYETIEFTSLSEDKMKEFLFNFDSNCMTQTLWAKLAACFYFNQEIVSKVKTVEERMSLHQTRYSKFFNDQKKKDDGKCKTIEYDQSNRFKGIITELGRGNPMNVFKEKIVGVSSSDSYEPSNSYYSNLFDFNNDKNYFNSKCEANSWVCYDFKERKVKLSHYSLRSHGERGKTNSRVKTWVIEGSNDNNEWKVIDKRENEESVVDVSASNTFKIDENISTNDFYRYIRIRQTNVNSCGGNYLVFSMIEFFGTILER